VRQSVAPEILLTIVAGASVRLSPHAQLHAPRSVARKLFAATLTLALLALFTPPNALSSAPLCSMPCCAGSAPHAAGSCTACHARLAARRKSKPKPEPFCFHLSSLSRSNVARAGVSSRTQRLSSNNDGEASRQDDQDSTRSVAPTTVSKPCPPDCGATAAGFAHSRRSRDAATLSEASRPRPPSLNASTRAGENLIASHDARRRQSRPRAPPAALPASL
jgi:hypothetical protein